MQIKLTPRVVSLWVNNKRHGELGHKASCLLITKALYFSKQTTTNTQKPRQATSDHEADV